MADSGGAELTDEAKQYLQKRGETAFIKKYGTHYVVGVCRTGNFVGEVKLTKMSSEDTVTARTKVEAEYQGILASGGGALDLELKLGNSLSNVQCTVSVPQGPGRYCLHAACTPYARKDVILQQAYIVELQHSTWLSQLLRYHGCGQDECRRTMPCSGCLCVQMDIRTDATGPSTITGGSFSDMEKSMCDYICTNRGAVTLVMFRKLSTASGYDPPEPIPTDPIEVGCTAPT